MNSSDKKSMLLVVFMTIFLGLLMIFFFKPGYYSQDSGAAVSGRSIADVIEDDFGSLYGPFVTQDDSDVSFINEKTYRFTDI